MYGFLGKYLSLEPNVLIGVKKRQSQERHSGLWYKRMSSKQNVLWATRYAPPETGRV